MATHQDRIRHAPYDHNPAQEKQVAKLRRSDMEPTSVRRYARKQLLAVSGYSNWKVPQVLFIPLAEEEPRAQPEDLGVLVSDAEEEPEAWPQVVEVLASDTEEFPDQGGYCARGLEEDEDAP